MQGLQEQHGLPDSTNSGFTEMNEEGLFKNKLGSLLIDAGVISAEDLDTLLSRQLGTGKRLGQVAVDEGFATEEQIVKALAKQLKIPFISLGTTVIDPEERVGEHTITVTSDQILPTVVITADSVPLEDGATFASPFLLEIAITDNVGGVPTPEIRLNGAGQAVTGTSASIPIDIDGGYLLGTAQ